MTTDEELIEQARMLIVRLERVSVDSIWARRSSGVRGELLKWVERLEGGSGNAACSLSPEERLQLENCVKSGFDYLTKAARERFTEQKPIDLNI